MVEYVYDAWGNHAVLDANGVDIASATHIGNRNPFRYLGYFTTQFSKGVWNNPCALLYVKKFF